ncbi:hypothetical protein [Leadbetterella byssophila]|nr:hypothetical protein [Leadbetterella byssophila]
MKFFILPLISIALVCSNTSYAQNAPCKTKVEVDDFTGETKLYSQGVEVIVRRNMVLSSKVLSWYLRISFEKESDIFLRVRHETNDDIQLSLVTGLDVKFYDGSVLRLSDPIDKGEKAGKFLVDRWERNYSSLFILTKDQLDMFASKKIVKCRAVFAANKLDPTFEKEIKTNVASKVQKEAGCFLDTLLTHQ